MAARFGPRVVLVLITFSPLREDDRESGGATGIAERWGLAAVRVMACHVGDHRRSPSAGRSVVLPRPLKTTQLPPAEPGRERGWYIRVWLNI